MMMMMTMTEIGYKNYQRPCCLLPPPLIGLHRPTRMSPLIRITHVHTRYVEGKCSQMTTGFLFDDIAGWSSCHAIVTVTYHHRHHHFHHQRRRRRRRRHPIKRFICSISLTILMNGPALLYVSM